MRRVLLVASALLLAGLPPASAWTAGPDAPHHADLAVRAAERLPAPERDLILRNLDAFRQGAVDPDERIHTFFHAYETADGGGGGLYRVLVSLRQASLALREGAPEAEAAYRLGVLTHFVMDLAVPFHTGEDVYDHRWHAVFERAAYDHRAQLSIPPGPPPREVADPEARTRALARASAALAEPLLAAMAEAGGGWSPEVAILAGEAAALGVEATADFLHTAFLWADPARPAPPPVDVIPVPKDWEDVALGLTQLRREQPGMLAAGTLAFLAVLTVGVALALGRWRRREHRLRAP